VIEMSKFKTQEMAFSATITLCNSCGYRLPIHRDLCTFLHFYI